MQQHARILMDARSLKTYANLYQDYAPKKCKLFLGRHRRHTASEKKGAWDVGHGTKWDNAKTSSMFSIV